MTVGRRAVLMPGRDISYRSPHRGLALLDEAIEQIEYQSKLPGEGEWNQGEWRCGSGMCLAGWVAQLAGGAWATDAQSWASDYLVPLPGETNIQTVGNGTVKGVHVESRALDLLGIDPDEYSDRYDDDDLFGEGNSLEDIRRLRDGLANSGAIK